METQIGIITFIYRNKKYGFIQDGDGNHYFFHKTGVINPSFKDLKAGMEVEFMATKCPKGMSAIGIVVK